MDTIIISTLSSTVFSTLQPILQNTIGAFLSNRFDELNIHQEQKKLVQQAMKKTLEEWLIAILNNLKAQEYQEEELQQFSQFYQAAFKAFLHDPQVVEELLQPFFATTTDYRIDSQLLMQRWNALNLRQLPEEFDIVSVNRAYLRRIKNAGIITPALRELFQAQLAPERTYHLQTIRRRWPDFNLEQYIKRVRKKYQVLELSALTPPSRDDVDDNPLKLKDIFVPPMVRASCPPRELPKEIWQRLQEQGEIPDDMPNERQLKQPQTIKILAKSEQALTVVAKPANNRIILLGDPGAGKSTLARYLLLSLLDENAPLVKDNEVFTNCLPLLVELRHYLGWLAENKSGHFLEYFHYLGKTEEYGLNHLELKPLLNTQKTLVIFDGLDEIFDPAQREHITQAIIGFALDYEKARVLVTSRIIGYQGKALRAVDFHEYTLQDFELEQIKTFAQGWFNLVFPDKLEEATYRYQRIETALQNSPAIRQLAGNPLLLTIIAIIAKHQELPRERVKLYEHATKVLCHHWDVTGHKIPVTETPADFMQEDDKLELLRKIAWRMQASTKGLAGNFILGDDLRDEITNYLRTRWGLAEEKIGQISQAMITQFRVRNFILCLYGAQVYGFVHRTFLEYFCATEIAYRFEKERTLSFNQLKTKVFLAHFRDETWHEVLRLICGILAPHIVEQLIRKITSRICFRYEIKLKDLQFAQTCLNEINDFKQIESTIQNLYLKWKKLVDHKNKYVSYTAIGVLAEYYRDRLETYSLLQQVVVNNEHELVRYMAFQFLIEYYHDRLETYSLLQQVVVNDGYEKVRCAAVKSLAKHYHERGETYSLLQQVVVNDEYEKVVRCAAVESLAERYHECSETYSLLQQVVVNDGSAGVRYTAVKSLAKHYREYPETYSLLQQVVVNDKHEKVRCGSVMAIAKNYYKETWQRLLSKDFHPESKLSLLGLKLFVEWCWLDSKALIDEKRVKKAAKALELPPETIRQHYEEIAKEIPLRLAWHEATVFNRLKNLGLKLLAAFSRRQLP